MNVLSLFDGMSCGQIALNRAGFKIDSYFACEIDKHAIKVTQSNYPDTIQLGDVTKVDSLMLPRIDLIMGGSPCQGFSFAGKQLNFNDPRSALFFEFVRLLGEVRAENPNVKFLLENVKMKKEYQDVISHYLGVQPIQINSALVSAQNRVRLYWTNLEGVEQPRDLGLLLNDVLNDGSFSRRGKSLCLTQGYQKLTSRDYHEKSKGQQVQGLNSGAIRGRYINKATIVGRRLDENGTRKDYDKTVPITQCLEVRATNLGKSNCLTTVEKDNVLSDLPPGRYPGVYEKDIPYRKLTPVECERLQTVPDNYTAVVSNSQRFRMLGNGWTVDVIAHILKSDISL